MALSGFSRKFVGGSLSPEDKKRALEELFVFGKGNEQPFLYRMMVLTIISTVIATGGLMSDSAAVVIGAMLVAPLMRPVMSAAAAITMGWSKRLHQSLLLITLMAIGVIALSAMLALLSPDTIAMTEQTLARTRPTFFDLVIALASGVGGAYVLTRKESSAIPGVAMAVSLLPPLAACGVLLEHGDNNLAIKAFILFFTNFLAMILAASLTFVVTGVRSVNKRKNIQRFIVSFILLFTVLIGATSVPLFYYSNEQWFDVHYRAAKSEVFQAWLKENNLEVVSLDVDEKNQEFTAVLRGPRPPLSLETFYKSLKQEREKKGEFRPFTFHVSWLQSVRSSWPPPTQEVDTLENVSRQVPSIEGVMLNIEWRWKSTQYSDAYWVENKNPEKYAFTLNEKNVAAVKVDCNRMQMGYQVNRDLLDLTMGVMTLAQCENPELDQSFINDLGRVASYKMVDDNLVLLLSNNVGVMYFIREEDK